MVTGFIVINYMVIVMLWPKHSVSPTNHYTTLSIQYIFPSCFFCSDPFTVVIVIIRLSIIDSTSWSPELIKEPS